MTNILSEGCKRVNPKLDLDKLDNNLSNDLSNNLDHTSLASRANKIYDVKITNYGIGSKKLVGVTYTIPAKNLYSRTNRKG